MPYKNPADRNAYMRRRYQEDPEHRRKHLARVARNNALTVQRLASLLRSLKIRCIRCGESDYVALDFHHRDSSTKDLDVSRAASHRWGEKRLLAEVEKCDVLCANCHRKAHAGR